MAAAIVTAAEASDLATFWVTMVKLMFVSCVALLGFVVECPTEKVENSAFKMSPVKTCRAGVLRLQGMLPLSQLSMIALPNSCVSSACRQPECAKANLVVAKIEAMSSSVTVTAAEKYTQSQAWRQAGSDSQSGLTYGVLCQ